MHHFYDNCSNGIASKFLYIYLAFVHIRPSWISTSSAAIYTMFSPRHFAIYLSCCWCSLIYAQHSFQFLIVENLLLYVFVCKLVPYYNFCVILVFLGNVRRIKNIRGNSFVHIVILGLWKCLSV